MATSNATRIHAAHARMPVPPNLGAKGGQPGGTSGKRSLVVDRSADQEREHQRDENAQDERERDRQAASAGVIPGRAVTPLDVELTVPHPGLVVATHHVRIVRP